MLCRKLKRRSVRTAENHRHMELPAGHVQHLRSGVHDLIERKKREVPRHELDDRTKPNHRGPDTNARKSELGDRSIDDAHRAEFVEQSLRNLVRSVVLRDFLSHQEYAIVTHELFTKRLVQRVAVGKYWHGQLVVYEYVA